MARPIEELDATATLAAVSSTLRWRRAAEVEDLRLAQHWADLHADDPGAARKAAGLPIRCFEDRLVAVGGPGGPRVRESAVAELAIAREIHPLAASRLLGDALDLRHRLPRTWSVVQGLAAEVWLARRVATLTRGLAPDRVALVDAAVAEAIGSESPARVLELTRAKVIEADPETHQAAVEAEKRRRYVALGRTDEHGLRHLVARVTAGDAAWIDATVDRVADILAARHREQPDPTRPGPTQPVPTRDELRATAMGWLARPAELLRLLLEHSDVASTNDDADDDREDRSRATAFPTDLLGALRALDPAKVRPPVVVYVHLHEAAVTGATSGVARVEGLGPQTLARLHDLLGHAHVTVRPVIDLRDRISVNAYEHPESVKERVHLTRVGDYFPYAAGTSRRADLDHPTPYDVNGPPGQTGTHNSGPLTRRHHRLKTHAGFRARQIGPGCYVWRTPRGNYLVVDPTGTHPVSPEHGEMLMRASQLELRLAAEFLAA
jgi:hypothetical protein